MDLFAPGGRRIMFARFLLIVSRGEWDGGLYRATFVCFKSRFCRPVQFNLVRRTRW